MSEYIHIGTLRIRRRSVAIISVLIALTLMTTISYNAVFASYAAGGDQTQQEETDETKPLKKTTPERTRKMPAEEEKASSEKDNGDAAGGDSKAESKTGSRKSFKKNKKAARKELTVNGKPVMPEISSSSYYVMSGSTSETIIQHFAERKMSPGHITMLVTAMVAIDNMYNEDELNNTVDITNDLLQYGSDFKSGESVKVGDLLDAMLVGGSEQAAEALAKYSASKRKIFIRMMNSKAMELGLMDTQFSNPKGTYAAPHYSTAKDCAVITQAAIRYPLIKEALSKKTVEFTVTKKGSERVVGFRNTNPLLLNDDDFYLYELTEGGVMGTVGTPVRGSQYAGVALIDDMQFVAVLMDSAASNVAYEAKGLFEYANTIVTRNTIVKAGKRAGLARVRGGVITYAFAYTATQGFAYVPPEGSQSLIETKVVMDSDLEAPLSKGDKVGEYRIYVADELKGTVDLVIDQDIPKGWPPSQIYISNMATVMICVILGILLLFALRILYVKMRRKRRWKAKREMRLREIARLQYEMDEDRKRRNWTYSESDYDKVDLRISDLRKEAEETAEEEQTSAPEEGMTSNTQIDKKRTASVKKAKKAK